MSARFEEVDWSPTPIGEVSLRRRRDPVTGVDIFEAKLGDEFLMSSLFTVAEIEVARLALARLQGSELHIAVGGLGRGYTAQAVLADERVREVLVIDTLEPVIQWHQRAGPGRANPNRRPSLPVGARRLLRDERGAGVRPRDAEPGLRHRRRGHRPLT